VQTAITVISARCRVCWSATKSRKPLTIKQIKNKKTSGDLHAVVADLMLKTKKENANLIKKRVMTEYWEKQRQLPITQLTQNLRQQVAKYKNRYHAYKAQTKNSVGENSLLEHHKNNYEMARRVRDDLLARAKAGEVFDVDVPLARFFKKGVSDV